MTDGRTDGQTDGRTDGRTEAIAISPTLFYKISLNLYASRKGNFREICKSQNINTIFPTPKFNLGIIQIIIKSLLTIFSV